jgi:hypothetical protein
LMSLLSWSHHHCHHHHYHCHSHHACHRCHVFITIVTVIIIMWRLQGYGTSRHSSWQELRGASLPGWVLTAASNHRTNSSHLPKPQEVCESQSVVILPIWN